MPHKPALPVLLFIVAAATGWIAWSGIALLLPVSVLFPVLWSMAPGRMTAALVSAGYFLAASRGLPLGAATFYRSDLWSGLLLGLGASVSFVGIHTVLWSKNSSARPLRYVTAALLMALPPFGIFGWAHPITAAGVFLPGWGWWGVGAMTAGLGGLAARVWPTLAVALAGLWMWSAVTWTGPVFLQGWSGIDTRHGASLGRDTGLQRHLDLIRIVRNAAKEKGSVIVLPESALGSWTPTVERLWVRRLSGTETTVIAGAWVVREAGYDNVLVAMSAAGGHVLYRQRMPVPGAMWQPWLAWLGQGGGAEADVFANPVVELGRTRIAPLICYEQLLVWPALQSMLHDPEVIVAVGNGWWTADTSVVAIQRASVVAWARLFAKPFVISFNT